MTDTILTLAISAPILCAFRARQVRDIATEEAIDLRYRVLAAWGRSRSMLNYHPLNQRCNLISPPLVSPIFPSGVLLPVRPQVGGLFKLHKTEHKDE